MKAGHTYVIVVPKSTTTTDGTTMRAAVGRTFHVTLGSTLRLQQILSELGYLPLRFVPIGPYNPVSSAVQRGMFTWKWRTVPVGLSSLWQPGVFNVITKGALMRFEDVNGMSTEGQPTTQVWNALLSAVDKGKVYRGTYDYVDVNSAIPETLTLYVNMHVIYTTLVNTGIASRPTALETNPVYLRYISTTMTGTNPNGSHYSDPGIPWVSYFRGGEALHGYIRSSYGWPQSLGCVEMPYAHAKVVWPYTPIGTLVTVR
jgi:peptidoglycan hydrolase-like protein with peptidoglycan-binding domain